MAQSSQTLASSRSTVLSQLLLLPLAPLLRLAPLLPLASLLSLALCMALALGTPLSAQTVTEDFSEGFSAELGWSGDLAAFAGEDGRLVLRDGRADPSSAAAVSFPAVTRDTACWTLDVAQEFSASTSNRLRYWLAADRPLVADAEPEGYYLQFGGISGSDDALVIFYEDAGGQTLVAAGEIGFAAADPLAIKVTVCANTSRQWTLVARDAGGGIVDEAAGTGPVALAGQHVGLDVRFTRTRNGLLSVDDLSVGPVFVDEEAPRLVLAKAEGPETVLLIASEPLDAGSLAVGNYAVDGEAVRAVATAGDTVRLTLVRPLPDGVETEVLIRDWRDVAGNSSAAIIATVVYVAPRQVSRYEVLITEIMADPAPSIGLPEVEYVELYNAGGAPVQLGELTIATSRTDATLPDTLLAPGDYLALSGEPVDDSRYVVFEDLPNLPNGGTVLRLLSGDRVIDEVAYDDGLLPTGKRDGGYSLERVDLGAPCARAADNFAASVALAGGTPGAVNSVEGSGERQPPLQLLRVSLQAPDTLVVTVNRLLGADADLAFLLNDEVRAEVIEGAVAGQYVLVLDEALRPGTPVTVTLSREARSCVAGEEIAATAFVVGIPDVAAPGDWALNEIMYDPLAGQGRWVELANVSDKLLTLDGLLLAETDAAGAPVDAFDVEAGVLVPPGGFLVVADDKESLLAQYPEADAALVVEADIPTLGEEACLSLVDAVAEERYFLVCYTGDWHNGAFAKTDGVSLERIDLNASASDGDNWTSAASTVGFATPTRANSQARLEDRETNATLALVRERLSPNGDGFEDLLVLDYAFEEPGTLVTFEVVDLAGRSRLRPAEQEAVANVGTWTWDGVTDDGSVAEIGTYVLRVEWFGEGRVAQREFLAFGVVGER